MLLFHFKYARCNVDHVGEMALKLLPKFTTLRAEVAFKVTFVQVIIRFRVQFGINLLQ